MDIENNEENNRYEVTLDGKVVAFAEYKSRPDKITFTHTQVDPDYEGKGIGSRLAKTALDDAVSRGLRITLYCPFITAYVDRHREYAKHIDPPRSNS